MSTARMYNVDVDKIERLAYDNGMTLTALSVASGHSNTLMSAVKSRGTMSTRSLFAVAQVLGVNYEELMLKDTQEAPDFPKSDFEKEVREMLKMLVKDVQELKQALLKEPVKAEEAQQTEAVFLPEIDRAVNLLEKMMGNRRWLKYEDYRLALEDEEDIVNGEMLSAAINKLGLRKMARGYGNNKTLWIVTDEAKQKLDNDNEGDE